MFIVINIGNKLLRKLLKIAFKKLHNEMISTFWKGGKVVTNYAQNIIISKNQFLCTNYSTKI